METFILSLCQSEIFVVFLIAALGYLLGGIKIKSIEVGTAGVLLVALLFGHFSPVFGFSVPSFVSTLGTVLFVGAVGCIAGPNFFRNFKQNAKSYILLGIIIVFTGSLVCLAIIKLGKVPAALASGLLTGALTSTPGLAAATEAANAVQPYSGDIVAVGYGIAYPFGVVGVVLFVQLLPKLLKVDMEAERASFLGVKKGGKKTAGVDLISLDPLGLFPFCVVLCLGVLLGQISIPLPGGIRFSLGSSGGPLIAGLILSHFGHAGRLSLSVRKDVLNTFREFGLCLFLIGAGFKGGLGFADTLRQYGISLFLYGIIMTLLPMLVGFCVAKYAWRLSLFNNLGSICGGMTSTPALGTLIRTTKTDDVASAYAATYPVALVCVVLCAQFLVLLFS